MANGWKRGAEILLARGGAAALARRRNSPSTAILAYHNIVPTGEPVGGDLSLHVDQAVFANQLDSLLEHCDVVPLSELREPPTPSSGRPRLVITFDDAYIGALTAGLEELTRRGLPVTVFVPPGLLGSPGFWWDRLAPSGGGPLTAELREHCLQELEGRGDRIVRWARERGLPVGDLPEHARPADGRMLLERGAGPGVALGAHTWSHPNLARLVAPDVEEELVRSKNWLQKRGSSFVDWLAYPYGRRNEPVMEAAARWFSGALRIPGGLAQRRGRWQSGAHDVPRLNVPRGLTLEGLALRLAGLLA